MTTDGSGEGAIGYHAGIDRQRNGVRACRSERWRASLSDEVESGDPRPLTCSATRRHVVKGRVAVTVVGS